MANTTTQTTSLIAFTLPSTPYSVHMARFYIRAALTYHELGDYTEDAETVSSELVTNAIMHAGGPKFGLEVMHLADFGAVAIIVTDPSPNPPIKRDPAGSPEHGDELAEDCPTVLARRVCDEHLAVVEAHETEHHHTPAAIQYFRAKTE